MSIINCINSLKGQVDEHRFPLEKYFSVGSNVFRNSVVGFFFSFSAGVWNWYSQSLCKRVCRAASECLLSASTGPERSAFANTGDFSSTFILNAGKHPAL